jgi:hypothetical protein
VCEGTGRFPHCIKEGGTWGKHGFPHESEPNASDAHCFSKNFSTAAFGSSVAIESASQSRA